MRTNLKKILKDRGYTMRDVAANCGVNVSNLSRFARRGDSIGFKKLCEISDYLGISLDDLRPERKERRDGRNQDISAS